MISPPLLAIITSNYCINCWFVLIFLTSSIHVAISDAIPTMAERLRQAREQSRGSSKRNVDEAACAVATRYLRMRDYC